MSTSTADHPLTTAANLPQETVDAYQRDGFAFVPSIISPEEVAEFYPAAIDTAAKLKLSAAEGVPVFDQCVNAWQHSETMKKLTLHKSVAAIAQKLAGAPLRLWHDHILIKQPKNSAPTEFHQDQPYWPHAGALGNPISCWIALCDVPVDRGCMTFIPGFQGRDDLAQQNLRSASSLFDMCPEMVWSKRITLPLRAGDCTFHHGRAPHMAVPNITDDPRVAHVMIYIDEKTTFKDKSHVVTGPMDIKVGDVLDGPMFPTVASILDK